MDGIYTPSQSNTVTIVKNSNDSFFYFVVLLFLLAIVGFSIYIINQTQVKISQTTNIPVSESTNGIVDILFTNREFEFNKKVLWKLSYPETLFADENSISTGRVNLSGEYLNRDLRILMSFPEFKDYANGIPFSFSDWLSVETSFVSEIDKTFLRTEFIQISGIEAALVYNYPQIVAESPKRLLGNDKTIVLYIWKTANSNPRRIIFEMDNFDLNFVTEFSKDIISDLQIQ